MKVARILFLFLLAGLVVPTAAPANAAAAPATPRLVDIRAAHHPGFDRIVFQFAGRVPAVHRVRYVDRLIGDASGLPVRISGRAILRVVFRPADAHDSNGPTAPQRKAFGLPNILTAVQAGDFEAVTTYGIGLAKRTPFHVHVLRNPSRVVIDVRAAFRTVNSKVFLFNRKNFIANDQPFFTPVVRPVPAERPAGGALDQLFAGPLNSERAAGLRLLRSHATGFTGLSIKHHIARVRLLGRCSSDGSTVTVAGEIMPTLRSFPRVDWVKIYDPSGHTERPRGQSDSIPACLEP